MLKANNSSSVHLTQFFWQAPGALTYAEKNTLFEVQMLQTQENDADSAGMQRSRLENAPRCTSF